LNAGARPAAFGLARSAATSRGRFAGGHRNWLLQRIREKDFTLRGLVAELAARGLKVDYRSVWSFVHDEKLSFKKAWWLANASVLTWRGGGRNGAALAPNVLSRKFADKLEDGVGGGEGARLGAVSMDEAVNFLDEVGGGNERGAADGALGDESEEAFNLVEPGGIEGPYDEIRTGRPRTVADEAVAELITKTSLANPRPFHWGMRDR
jgi:hypothetical protein